MSPERVQRLDALGFVWDPFDDYSETMFSALVEFKNHHGHCNVTRRWVQNPALAMWVGSQRGRKDKLSPERVQKLDALGFQWNRHAALWEEQYGQLVNFKDQHGHCNVPRRWAQDPGLAMWVTRQRSEKDRLSLERVRRLDALGFTWGVFDSRWEAMFAALIEFKNQFGHCTVPQNWPDDLSLGSWTIRQRTLGKSGRLDAGLFQRLDALGLVWDQKAAFWDTMFAALVEFKNKHGHCEVPQRRRPDGRLAA